MKAKLHQIGLATCAIIVLLSTLAAADSSDDSDIINPNWVKPGWKNHRPRHDCPASPECPAVPKCKCLTLPECPEIVTEKVPLSPEEHRNAFIYYRKFVRRVFDEQKLEVDPANPDYKVWNIQFKISDTQVEMLREAGTAGEIDAVLTEIVEQSEGSFYDKMTEGMCRKLFSMYKTAEQSTVFRYWVLPAVALLIVIAIGYVFNKKVWIVIAVLFILITYVLTYRDCNDQLELESLTRLMKIDQGRNPCNKVVPSRWLPKCLQSNTDAECMEHLREVHGLKRDFCDPTEVFIQMVAKLQIKYFETFLEQMISTFKSTTAKLGWFERSLVAAIVGLFTYVVLTNGIKYTAYASGRFLADTVNTVKGRGRRGEEPIQGAAQQAPPQLPPTYNINIVNVPNRRRMSSNAKAIPSRVEEIRDGAEQMALPVAAAATSGEIMNASRPADGSGDGPAKVVREKICDDESSGDESIEVIQDQHIDDIQQMVNESLANDARNQSNIE